MIRRKVNIAVGSLVLFFLSASLTFSTVHTHHHIQWHHSGDFTDTGNCITADISICPICAHQIKSDFSYSLLTETGLLLDRILEERVDLFLPQTPIRFDEGRSPPAIA